jgi:manganese/zinc/iron transport system substrate-binding protein
MKPLPYYMLKLTLLLLFTALFTAAGCSDSQANRDDGKTLVLCTTTHIHDLAKELAADLVEIQGIMKSGEDPHIYEIQPRDYQAIDKADLILMNGLHLEAQLTTIIHRTGPKDAVIKLAEDARIPTSRGTDQAPDPHCWLNINYYKVYAEKARDALIKVAPEHKDEITERAAAYIKQLTELHVWAKAQIGSVPKERRIMITSHDAFQYFGKAYDIEVHAVIGMSTEDRPTPRQKIELLELVKKTGAKALFPETSVSNALNDIVKQIAESTGASVGTELYSDSLGDPNEPVGTYIGMFRHNVNTIVKALK